MGNPAVPKTWILQDVMKVAAEYLKEKGIDNPRLSAELLLAHQLDIPRIQLYLDFDRPLTEEEVAGYRSLIKRRILREPIQYITGRQEFWSMEFAVGPDVLIPRPESEILVEQVLLLKREGMLPEGKPLRVLDIGTGSGCLAVSVAKEIEEASLWATDVSGKALSVALLNARRHGMEGRIEFRQGDIWQPFAHEEMLFEMILSNPPYISSGAMDTLPQEVRDYEPRGALDGGEEGLFYIKRILSEGPAFLSPGGWVLLEMDPEQIPKAVDIVESSGFYGEHRRVKDHCHRYRVLMARKG
ncbi:MAG: peptide chain release factor N(5)-glutamine methyltransferase [Deltaproteobacteria bacterium]|nr:peptide chain release factor N(5)-glutamine methyltransferase [Deltaproteobacteria bacterium]